jgi:hypothetical protein
MSTPTDELISTPSPSSRPDDSDYISFSPTPSFAESFSTAHTRLDSNQSSTPLLSPHAPLQNLRKSLSVDSFVQYNHDNYPTTSPRPTRASLSSTLGPGTSRAFTASTDRNRDRQFRRPLDEDFSVDSDVERSDPLNGPLDRYRHTSLKDPRPLVRGGELPLPSRTPALSTTSSVSSIASTLTSSSTLEDRPRQQSHSLQFFPGRAGTSLSPSSGRIRSGSLGIYPNTAKRVLINTQVSDVRLVVLFVS